MDFTNNAYDSGFQEDRIIKSLKPTNGKSYDLLDK